MTTPEPTPDPTNWLAVVATSSVLATGVTLAAGRFDRWWNRPHARWMLYGGFGWDADSENWIARFAVLNCGDGPAFRVEVSVQDVARWPDTHRDDPDVFVIPDPDGHAMAVCGPGDHWNPVPESDTTRWMKCAATEDSTVIVSWFESPTERPKKRHVRFRLFGALRNESDRQPPGA